MASFEKYEMYAKEYTIDEDKYLFKPLGGKHFPKLFGVMKKLNGNEDILKVIDEKVIEDLIYLQNEMVKVSYPNLKEQTVEAFVKANIMELIEPLFDVNMNIAKSQPRLVQKEINKS